MTVSYTLDTHEPIFWLNWKYVWIPYLSLGCYVWIWLLGPIYIRNFNVLLVCCHFTIWKIFFKIKTLVISRSYLWFGFLIHNITLLSLRVIRLFICFTNQANSMSDLNTLHQQDITFINVYFRPALYSVRKMLYVT